MILLILILAVWIIGIPFEYRRQARNFPAIKKSTVENTTAYLMATFWPIVYLACFVAAVVEGPR